MFGSKHVFNLGYRDMWALISKKKNTWFAEAHHKAPKLFDWGSPLEIQATVPLDSESSACKWGDDATSERRRQFCNKYEGYGDVCRCKWDFQFNVVIYFFLLYGVDCFNLFCKTRKDS